MTQARALVVACPVPMGFFGRQIVPQTPPEYQRRFSLIVVECSFTGKLRKNVGKGRAVRSDFCEMTFSFYQCALKIPSVS